MARRFYVLAALLVGLGAAGFLDPSSRWAGVAFTPALNALHLALGLGTAIAAARGLGTMRAWGKVAGLALLALAIAALTIDSPAVARLLPLTGVNAALHGVLAIVFLYHALLAPPTL